MVVSESCQKSVELKLCLVQAYEMKHCCSRVHLSFYISIYFKYKLYENVAITTIPGIQKQTDLANPRLYLVLSVLPGKGFRAHRHSLHTPILRHERKSHRDVLGVEYRRHVHLDADERTIPAQLGDRVVLCAQFCSDRSVDLRR